MTDHQRNGCFHCGLPIPIQDAFVAEFDDAPRQFCCFGCQSVCAAIYASGMQGFYNRTPDGVLLEPPPPLPQNTTLFDLDEVQEEFIQDLGHNREIHLLIEGIHCSACVWLIERTLQRQTGVRTAQVNLAGKKLLLRWDNEQVKLSQIIQQLGRIGYAATPFDPEAAEGVLKKQNRALLFRMAFAGFTMMNLLWVSIALYSGADKGEFKSLFQWVGFALATPTLFYSGWPFLKGAWSNIKTLHLGMDLPIAIGASVTWAYSSWITFSNSSTGNVYFDTVVNFLFVILVGRHLEGMSKRHAVAATQRLLDLQPRIATLLIDNEEKIVPVRSIKKGQIVLIRAGDKVPVDGIIIAGESTINESMLSGESQPVNKVIGDGVSAGTINTRSALSVEVTDILQNTALGRIIRLVEDAQASKAPIQCIADKIVPWFVFTTLLLATITFFYWYSNNVELALLAATSVLIITCPCAFGLATPMAIAVASGQGAKHGILVKNGEVLETLSHIKHFVFDKTGTLTEGKMRVHQVIVDADYKESELLAWASAIERFSEHNTGKAIIEYAETQHFMQSNLQINQFSSTPGFGISAQCDGQTIILGTLNWLHKNQITDSQKLITQAQNLEQKSISCVHMSVNGQHVALIGIADNLRPDAKALIQQLRDNGIKLTLLSGDRKAVAETIAQELGGMQVIAEVLPEDKDQVIQEIQKTGAQVAMVGDGVNDAPALIRADVGIAISSGTDVSVESADIVLMGDELNKIHLAQQLSSRTLKAIKQNIGISITYNLIMVPLAMSALITPLIAAISMPISSLLVIGNAARIRTLFKK